MDQTNMTARLLIWLIKQKICWLVLLNIGVKH